jgi:hypothetical protein
MGAISKMELDNELRLVLPSTGEMAQSMKTALKVKMESFLVDDVEVSAWKKGMFAEPEYGNQEAERTLHTDIPPANVRIQNVERKSFK